MAVPCAPSCGRELSADRNAESQAGSDALSYSSASALWRGLRAPANRLSSAAAVLEHHESEHLVTVEHVVGIQQMAGNIVAERQKNPNSYRRPLWQYIQLAPVYKFSQRTIESILRGEYDGAPKSPAAGARPQGGGRVRPEVLSPQLIEKADEVIDGMNNRDPPAPVSYMDALKEIHRLHPTVMAPVRCRARRSCPSARR